MMSSYQQPSSSSSSSNVAVVQKIDSIIADCFQKSSDILIPSRNAFTVPKVRDLSIERFSDTSDYCRQVLKPWTATVTQPLMIDLSYIDPTTQRHLLIEKWLFVYQRKESSQEARPNIAQLKVVTFLRTLYSMVRLLPGFQLLNSTRSLSTMSFHMYNPETTAAVKFTSETGVYDFPRINTGKGILSVGVRYIEAVNLQRMLGTPVYYILRPLSSQRSSGQRTSNSSSSSKQPASITSTIPPISPSSRRNSPGSSEQLGIGIAELYDPTNTPTISPSNRLPSSQPPSHTKLPVSQGMPISNKYPTNLKSIQNSPDSAPTSFSPPANLTFLLDQNTQMTFRTAGGFHPWDQEQQATVDPRLLTIPQIPAIEDTDPSSISPPYPHSSSTLLSTSPQIGGSIVSHIQNLRGSTSHQGSNRTTSPSLQVVEPRLTPLPSSPFEQPEAPLSTSLKQESNIPVPPSQPQPHHVSSKDMNRFIKEVITRNRAGVSLYTISSSVSHADADGYDDAEDDDDDDRLRVQSYGMAFVSQSTPSSADHMNIAEENYSRVIPLKYKSMRSSGDASSMKFTAMDLLSPDTNNRR